MAGDEVPEELSEREEPAARQTPGATRNRTFLVLVTSIAVVLAVVAAALGFLLLTSSDDDDAASELRRTAGRFGEALVTYDYRTPDEHREEVMSFATGSFREEYEDAFDQGLVQIITEVEAVSTGVVKDVYLSEVDEETASAIVVVDIEHDGTAGERTLYDIYFRLSLVRVGDEWKVDQVTDLNFDSAPSGVGTGVTTTTTPTSTTSLP